MTQYLTQPDVQAILQPRLQAYWSKNQRTFAGLSDETFCVLPKTDLVQLVSRIRADRQAPTQQTQGFDCDDHAFLLKAEFCRLALTRYDNLRGSICIGIGWGKFEWMGRVDHATNWVVTAENEFWWVEPQSGEFYPVNKCLGDLTLILA